MDNSKLNRREFLKTSAQMAGIMAFGGLISQQAFAETAKGFKMESLTLNNGIQMPMLGLGVLNIKDLKECQRVVEDAIEVGYRLFDTAQSYGNEAGIGAAIKATGIKREEIFMTTKLFKDYATEDKVKAAFDESCKKLRVDYVDLFLIHQPINDLYGAWRAMSLLYKQKQIRAIGVCNFYADRLVDFCMNNEIIPAVNQCACNPFRQELELQKQCEEYHVAYEAFSPFAQGKNGIFSNKTLQKIAKKHKKSVAQVILRWLIERKIVAIPKTTQKERMRENLNIFDFRLDSHDKAQIASLEIGNVGLNHRDPAVIKWLNERKIGESLATSGKK